MISSSTFTPLISLFGNSPLLNNQTASPFSPSVSGTDGSSDPNQIKISGLGQLLASLYNFQYSVEQLFSPSATNNSISSSSSNGAVASTSAVFGAQPATYALSVSQLAQAQSAVTAFTLPDSGSTAVGSGTLSINVGSYAYTSPTSATSFTASGSAVNISISNGTLSSIASSINGAGAGVVANVVQNSSGAFSLQISQAQTGASNNFRILVTDSDGTNTNQDGLSRLAFDQTAAVGSGQNLTQTQVAQNANYTVNGVSGSSASNLGLSIATGVSVNLLTTGSSNITVNVDYGQLNNQAQSLSNAFNTLTSSLNSLISTGAVLDRDPIGRTLAQGLNQQATQSYSNGSSLLTTLGQVGLNFHYPQVYGQSGTLTLANSTLQSAYNGDSQGAANLLSTVEQSFDNFARTYASYANGTIPLTITALQKLAFTNSFGQSATAGAGSQQANLNALVQNQSGRTLLTAQQISALAQYAMVYSLGARYAIQAQILGTGLGLSSTAGGNGFSALA